LIPAVLNPANSARRSGVQPPANAAATARHELAALSRGQQLRGPVQTEITREIRRQAADLDSITAAAGKNPHLDRGVSEDLITQLHG